MFTPVFVCTRNAHVGARCFPFPAALECVLCALPAWATRAPIVNPPHLKGSLQTLCQRIVICQNVIYQTLPGRQLALRHDVKLTCAAEWESRLFSNLYHSRICFGSRSVQTGNVSNFDDKNDFGSNLQFMASICSGYVPLALSSLAEKPLPRLRVLHDITLMWCL